MDVGTVGQLWRYPVKSMLGERLPSGCFAAGGIVGDRGWAARDEVRGGMRGAKKIGGLMSLGARYLREPTDAERVPPVVVTLPDGRVIDSRDPGCDRTISEAVAHEVTMHPLRPATDLEHYRRGAPDHEDAEQELRAIFGREPDEPLPSVRAFSRELVQQLREFESPPGTYFDALPVMLMTDTSLRTLEGLASDSTFDVRRFRPNLMLTLSGAQECGFPEQAWIGRRLAIGEVELSIDAPCPRCVMVTRGFADVPEDRRVLRTIVREAGQNLGVYATVSRPGTVHENDIVQLLDQ